MATTPGAKPPIPLPPKKERTVKVRYNRSAKWRGGEHCLPATFTADRWEMELLRIIQPKRHGRIVPDLNGSGEHSRPYLRFAEKMPDGKQARHPLARYLHAARAEMLFLLGVGPKPDPCGPPIGPINGDPLDVRPCNRRELATTLTTGEPPTNRRKGYAAGWSVQIRVAALLRGEDPEEAFEAERERFKEAATTKVAGPVPPLCSLAAEAGQ